VTCEVQKENERLKARVKTLEAEREELKRLLAEMYAKAIE